MRGGIDFFSTSSLHLTPTHLRDVNQMGLIAISAVDQQPKIKIYRDNDGRCKGDCALCYYAESSFDMALEVLHEGYIRPGFQITVKKAEFQASSAEDGPQTQNQNQNQFKKSRPKLTRAQVKVAQSVMRQGVVWNTNDDMGLSKSQALKIVVLEGDARIRGVFY
jgi:HIV Tat-specific factor 1